MRTDDSLDRIDDEELQGYERLLEKEDEHVVKYSNPVVGQPATPSAIVVAEIARLRLPISEQGLISKKKK